ncbi:putative transposable element [Pseudoloma neurophilia]|uniref:Putative transposable element n=1 Tax=Pseudoloma neurophilia TaxID=146866 RepID=A0A0R0LVL9_9MICR|nr:putative transposable element [Pseudoloma neurophilia]
MRFAISKRYKWPSCIKKSMNIVKNVSFVKKKALKDSIPKKTIVTERDGQIWEINLVGRIKSKQNYFFIFVAVDHHSKWVEAQVISNKIPSTIIETMRKQIFDKHNRPECILPDCEKSLPQKKSLTS